MKSKTSLVERRASRQLLYFDIAAEIDGATSTDSLHRICRRAMRALKFDYYMFGGYYPIVEGVVISSNYPVAWRERYDNQNYIGLDPVVRLCWGKSRPVLWAELTYSEGKLGEQERALMREARAHGLCSGISIPLHGAGAEGCMLSLASKKSKVKVEPHDISGMLIILNAMHEVTKRIIEETEAGSVAASAENLSPREIECLAWTAKGKTSWAIARILEVSENTVTFHLRNAIRKLEVTNRVQAVAKAISLSKITPF